MYTRPYRTYLQVRYFLLKKKDIFTKKYGDTKCTDSFMLALVSSFSFTPSTSVDESVDQQY